MMAMTLKRVGEPLVRTDAEPPQPGPHEILIKVIACGVCRTDLHVADGDLPDPKLPLIPGHEIIGEVHELGTRVSGWETGDPIGVPWLAWTCGSCRYCMRDEENLCENARFTGYTVYVQ